MKKKLIFVSEALWVGGIETALVNLLNRLDYDKYDVTCLIVRDYQEMAERITPQCRLLVADRQHKVTFQNPYRHSRLFNLMEEPQSTSSARRLMWKSLCLFLRAPEMRLYANYIREQLGGEHFDTCIIYSDRTAELAVRGIDADRYLLFYHNAKLEKAYHDEIGYKKADRIIAVSESKAAELREFRYEYAAKIVAIHNLVDIDSIKEKSKLEPTVEFPKETFNIVTCGRLAHQKAIDWAIVTCKELMDNGQDFHWWIVGGGPDESALGQQIKEYGVEERFHLLGMQSNPYPYIANADLYVQPSRYENYSVVILEAIVLCKPILATIPAASEQIISGQNGLLCEANPHSIAVAMEQLMENEEERCRYTSYLEEHSLEHENEMIMEQLYEMF
ncbi:MAG: glycosyltransferase [Clostridiales bacterium]|nr:glycosyltransferase [Clostridiales bacterium]